MFLTKMCIDRTGDFSVTLLELLINSVQKKKNEIYKYTKLSPLLVKNYVDTWLFKTLLSMKAIS